jgi:hypothetical protein
MKFSPQTVLLTRYIIWTAIGVIAIWLLTQGFPDESSALLVVVFASLVALFIFRRFAEDREYITLLFLAALAVRLVFGIIVHIYDLRGFFGGDAIAYDVYGQAIADYWLGAIDSRDNMYFLASTTKRPGWGMNYIIGAIYLVVGKNIIAAQSFCAVVGAATAPMVYFCAKQIYGNKSVAKTAALGVAFFPAFIIWSGQLLKDGLIIFLLVLVMTMVLQLQKRISYPAIIILLLALFGIITLRFYIFYMLAIAVAGSFLVGLSNKSTSIFRRAALLVVIGLGLTYIGVIRGGVSEIQSVDLERVQISRSDLAQSGSSGFAEDVDVSTPEGAISAIPIGFAYLMFAPFPWQLGSVRQTITLPEILVWWAMMPLMVWGIAYTLRHHLRTAFPILFFSLVLTLAYSIFQGNVGTAYRQRTQIQVFLFIFIAVGWQLWKERREDKKIERISKQRKFERRLRNEDDDDDGDDNDYRGYR